MTQSVFLLLGLSSISLFFLVCCEVDSDLKSECDKTKWEQVQEPTISIFLDQPSNFCDATNFTYKADTAFQVNVTGAIQKFYCDDTPSGRFDLSANYSPTVSSDDVRLGQRYMFKFQNDKDRLQLSFRLKAYFLDGSVFESEDLSFTYYFKNILFDVNSLEQYVRAVPGNFTWHTSH